MKQSRRSRLSSVSLCVALGLASSACVKPDAPTVGMSKVEASLVFGVTDIPQPIPTPVEQAVTQVAAVFAPVEPASEQAAPEEPSFEFAKPPIPRFAPQLPTTRREECPEAAITAAPEISPQPRISADPRLGTSRWRLQTTATVKNADGTPEERTSPEISSPRSIRDFKRESADVFTFQELTPLGDQLRISTYRVDNNAITRNPSDGVGIVATPGVGEPERGIVLVKEEIVEQRTGQAIRSFTPTGAGLLMLPIPVVAGERFTSTAVDARTGETRTHEATVLERQRVDACGDLVDGWGVSYRRRQSTGAVGTATAVAPNAVVNFTSVFATQYGGVPILERLQLAAGQCEICPLDLKQRVGQLNPDPLATP